MTKQEIMSKYNLCDATVRNWVKLGYIDNLTSITDEDIIKIIGSKKKQRKNKRNSEHTSTPLSYVNSPNTLSIINQILNLKNRYNIGIDHIMINVVKKILGDKYNNEIEFEMKNIFVFDVNNAHWQSEFDKINFEYNVDDDFLGALYMSLLSVGDRDKNGIFYTPSKVVDQALLSISNIISLSKILDPGCGSGNFLIKLYNSLKANGIDEKNIIDRLYGYDIDKIAVFLAKINIYKLTSNTNFSNINIYCKDFVLDTNNTMFDLIIGNPPWGKKYTKHDVESFSNKFDERFAKSDSFTHFILAAFNQLNIDGQLIYILPSSILNIAKHEKIREKILNKHIDSITQIGREFSEVVTNAIIIKMINNDYHNRMCNYNGSLINQQLFWDMPFKNFLIPTGTASNIINKIKKQKCHFLTKNIEYGLGIVTGNNDLYLKDNIEAGFEPVISGKELSKYFVDYERINKYILFEKDKLQQVAPEKLYRSHNKILYKFIGKNLTFSLENRGLLNLNSANMICIPESNNIYYILAVLNSRLTQLLFDEYYDTHKVLKNHIQSFPIYDLENNIQNDISNILKHYQSKNKTKFIEEIEELLYSSLKLTKYEIEYLKERYQ